MSSKIKRLTPEQINLIPAHLEKWKNIALSTERLDRGRAEQIINSAYELIEYQPPTIFFFDSPQAAYHFVLGQTEQQLDDLFDEISNKQLEDKWLSAIEGKLTAQELQNLYDETKSQPDSELESWYKKFQDKIYTQIDFKSINRQLELINKQINWGATIWTWGGLDYQFDRYIWDKFNESERNILHKYLGGNLHRSFRPIATISNSLCTLDYYVSNFDLDLNRDDWHKFKSLFQLGNSIFPRHKFCLICDRPTELHFDSKYRLHTEGKLAIRFADDTGFYSQRGTTLPPKYGKVDPENWQAKWLLEETNPSLRAALVIGLGCSRLSNQLPVTIVDRWQNYLLIRIDASNDFKLCYLLRIDNSIDAIHYGIEIPEDLPTVRQAADCINWDIFDSDFVFP